MAAAAVVVGASLASTYLSHKLAQADQKRSAAADARAATLLTQAPNAAVDQAAADSAGRYARDQQRKQLAGMPGRRSTLLTGSLGMTALPAVSQKPLVGL